MKKILYYTARDMTLETEGITKKIWNQIHALEDLGFQVDAAYRKNDEDLFILRGGKEKLIRHKMHRPYKVESSRFLRKYLKKHTYDGIYIRYVFDDPQFHRLLKALKKAGTKILIEIPTYPYDAELKDTLENRIVLFLDRLYRKRMKKYVDVIAAISDKKLAKIYGVPVVEIKNGVNFADISLAERNDKSKDAVNLVAVAGFAKWHAFERLINGIGEYRKNGGMRKILFHLVGDGPEIQVYKACIEKYGLEDQVILYGFKSGQELTDIYNTADIAVSSLGMHRIGLTSGQTLKSKEYGAKGLPVISEYDVTEYPRGKQYQLIVPMDESPLDVEKIIEMYDLIEASNVKALREEIRKKVQSRSDIKVVMRPVARFFGD